METRELSGDELARMREEIEKEIDDRKARGDEPRSYAGRNEGRRVRPTAIEGVLFQVRVPLGRRGETMPGFILFPPVRDERELSDLAEQVEREFRTATVYQPKDDHQRRGYGRDSGYDHHRDRDHYRRY